MADSRLPKADRDRFADDVNGVWKEAMEQLLSYRYFGTQSVLDGREKATGSMPIRSDMRTSPDMGGVLLAPVAIGMLDAAGNMIDRHYQLGLTQIDIHSFDGAPGAARMGFHSDWVREARTQTFTETTIIDEGDGRLVGHGSANWAVINPTPPGFVYTDPGPGPDDLPPMPPLWQVFEAERLGSASYLISALSPRLGTDTLHHGPILVVMEQAALDIAAEQAKGRLIVPVTLSCRIVRAGRKGPFVISAVPLATTGNLLSCRCEFRDQGRENEIVATMLWQATLQ